MQHETFQVCVHCKITCKYEKDRIKTIKKKWRHHFSIVSISGYFLDVQMQITRSIVDGPILPKFELFQNNLHVLVTYEFNMDRTNSNREKGGDIDFLTLKHS